MHSDRKTRDTTLIVCAMLLACLCARTVCAQAPALVYSTQIYGHGSADSLPGAGDPNLGKNAMVVDAAGNIYVTGSTFNGLNTDFLTVKYNAAGAIQWRAVTNGAANGDDLAYAVAVDAGGNVLVTGSSQSGRQSDYLTVKYDSNGVEQWRATMDGAVHGDDEAYAIAVDAAGNVVVTGASFVSFTKNNFDYVTVKYNPAGAEQWRMSMDGAGNSTDHAVALCLDASGNAVVTGYSANNSNYDYVTVKYLASGPELWKKVMNNTSANSNDVALAMACDAGGNVHVTGRSSNGSNFDYLTVKYSASGGEQWRTSMPVTPNVTRAAFAVAVDSGGNVVVTGSELDTIVDPGVTNPVHRTVKYDVNGGEQWRVALNGSGTGVDIFTALTTDSTGNIYTTGFADNAGNNELLVVKYAQGGGAPVWQTFVGGVGSASSAVLMAIKVDAAGNVVVAGSRNNGLDNDFLVVKFNSSGQELWRANEGENTGLSTTLASGATGRNALAVDAAGNVYVAGQSGLATNGDFITAKIDGSGNEQWRAVLNGSSGGVDRAYALAIDAGGNAYVSGDSFAGGYSDFMTVKYDASGAEQWRAQPGHAANTFNSARAIAVDPAGDVIVSGYSSAGAGILTIKYSANGFEQWKVPANVVNGSVTPMAMAVDAAGNAIVTGRSFDGVNEGYLTVKYSASGVEQWRAVLNGNNTQPRQPYAVAIDSASNVFVAGDSTVKYNANGIEQWHTTDTFRAYAMALAPGGAVVVGGTGGLIVKYDGSGGEVWRHAINGVVDGNDVVHTLAIDVDGSLYATGQNSTDLSSAYLTIKLDAYGNERWRLTTPTAGGGVNGTPALVLDANRKLILAGNAVTGGLPAAILIAKFSQAPQAPTGVMAVAGNGVASVSFTPPAASDSPIIGYTVTCQPGSVVATGPASPILIGLTNNVTYACSVAATNAFGIGQASTAASVTPSTNPPLALFAVKSRKTHGLAGDFDLNVDLGRSLGGAVTVEPRSVGAGHKLVFQFNNTVTTAGSVLATDANSVPVGSGTATPSGNDVVVTLTGVPDNQRVLTSFTATGPSGSVNATAALGFLVGDVSNTRSVNAADISAVKARIGQSISQANFRFDLDASGSIGASDVSAVKARSGLALP